MIIPPGAPSTASRQASSPPVALGAPARAARAETAPPRHGVTVAIEGLPHEIHAVRWAADEASRRGCPLTLLHVKPQLLPFAHRDPVTSSAADADAAGEDLDAWAAAALLHRPGLHLRTVRTAGHVDDHLVEASAHSELLVLGVNRARRHRPILGTVADQVAVHAHCPVVLAPVTPVGAGLTGDVVVVADRSQPVDHRVFRVAADEAVLHQAVLTVVRTDLLRRDLESDAAAADSTRPIWSALDDALAQVRRDHQDLDVRVVGNGGPGGIVPPADLVVVGSHHDDQLWAIDMGAVALDLISGAHCPIFLVPVLTKASRY